MNTSDAAAIADGTEVRRAHREFEEFIADLGRCVLHDWRARNFQRSAFPDVAASQLARREPHKHVDYETIVNWVVFGDALPYQQDLAATFGEPPLTLYWHSRFHIEALFWASSTPAIHNHSFSGAFTVLAGSSLHTTYEFEVEDPISDVLKLGTLRITGAQVLREGAIEGIEPGPRFIHSVFHLHYPSVTLVVRTHSDTPPDGRFEYFMPGVAFDATVEDQQRTRREQCLRLLLAVAPDKYRAVATKLLAESDLITTFVVLRRAVLSGLAEGELLDELMGAARRTWGSRMSVLEAALADARRQAWALALRRTARASDLRLIAGVLLTQPTREAVFESLAAHGVPGAPEMAIVEAVQRLSALRAVPIQMDRLASEVLLSQLEKPFHSVDAAVDRLVSRGVACTGAEVAVRLQGLSSVGLLRPLFQCGQIRQSVG